MWRISSSAIIALLVLCGFVGYRYARKTPPPPAGKEQHLTNEVRASLINNLDLSYSRPTATEFIIHNPDARVLRTSAEDAYTTGGTGKLQDGAYLWWAYSAAEFQAEATFEPVVLALHMDNPEGKNHAAFVRVTIELPNGTRRVLGTRRVIGPQYEVFTLENSSVGLHKLELALTASDPAGHRPPMQLKEIVLAE